MSFVKVMIHAVWGTKNHYPFLTKDIKPEIISHIRANAKNKGIFIDCLDGHVDHLHCLFSLNADLSISKTLQLMKGESAFWVNKQKLTKSKFEWADEYYAASVSDSVMGPIRSYIANQETHHKKITFKMEYEEFLKKWDFSFHG